MAKQTLTVQLMHATARIAELEAMVIAIDEIRSEQNVRIAELEAAKAAKPANTNRKVIAPRAPYVRPAWMEAARQAAMATGQVTLAVRA